MHLHAQFDDFNQENKNIKSRLHTYEYNYAATTTNIIYTCIYMPASTTNNNRSGFNANSFHYIKEQSDGQRKNGLCGKMQ